MNQHFDPDDPVNVEGFPPEDGWRFNRRPAPGIIELKRTTGQGRVIFKAVKEEKVSRAE
jgi:hypothetical protein